jgi:hypothetical protein
MEVTKSLCLAVRDERPNAHNRMKDVLREFLAKRLPHFLIAFALKAIGRCKAPQVGHCLDIPNNDALPHNRHILTRFGPLPVRRPTRALMTAQPSKIRDVKLRHLPADFVARRCHLQ